MVYGFWLMFYLDTVKVLRLMVEGVGWVRFRVVPEEAGMRNSKASFGASVLFAFTVSTSSPPSNEDSKSASFGGL